MRVTKVTFVDWLHDRQPHRTLQAVVPAKADGKPNENEDAPPAPEPDKGVHFEGWA